MSDSSMASLGLARDEVLAGFIDSLPPKERTRYAIMEYLIVECGGCSYELAAFVFKMEVDTPTKLTRIYSVSRAKEWASRDDFPESVSWVDMEQLLALVQALLLWKRDTSEGPKYMTLTLEEWTETFSEDEVDRWWAAEQERSEEIKYAAAREAQLEYAREKLQAGKLHVDTGDQEPRGDPEVGPDPQENSENSRSGPKMSGRSRGDPEGSTTPRSEQTSGSKPKFVQFDLPKPTKKPVVASGGGDGGGDDSSSDTSSDDDDDSVDSFESIIKTSKNEKKQKAPKISEDGTMNSYLASFSDTSLSTKPMVKVHMSDIKSFDGKQKNWQSFKISVQGMCNLLRRGHLLVVQKSGDVRRHLTKRTDNPEYNAEVQEFFSILLFKTEGGTAQEKVQAHQSTLDGVLAGRNLMKKYDYGGDKELNASQISEDLENLRLDKNTRGGYSWYESRFEKLTREMEGCGAPIPDFLKRSMFVNKIEDDTFKNITDSYTDYDLETLKTKLTTKAKKEKVYNGHAAASRRSNKKARADQRKKSKKDKEERRQNNTNTSNRNSSNRNSTNRQGNNNGNGGPPPGSGFSPKAWKQMSPENRKWILEHKDKDRQQYGNQYNNQSNSGNSNSQARQHSTTTNPSDGEGTNNQSSNSGNNNQTSGSGGNGNQDGNNQNQSIFSNPGRRQNMFRRAAVPPGINQGQPEPLPGHHPQVYYRVLDFFPELNTIINNLPHMVLEPPRTDWKVEKIVPTRRKEYSEYQWDDLDTDDFLWTDLWNTGSLDPNDPRLPGEPVLRNIPRVPWGTRGQHMEDDRSARFQYYFHLNRVDYFADGSCRMVRRVKCTGDMKNWHPDLLIWYILSTKDYMTCRCTHMKSLIVWCIVEHFHVTQHPGAPAVDEDIENEPQLRLIFAKKRCSSKNGTQEVHLPPINSLDQTKVRATEGELLGPHPTKCGPDWAENGEVMAKTVNFRATSAFVGDFPVCDHPKYHFGPTTPTDKSDDWASKSNLLDAYPTKEEPERADNGGDTAVTSPTSTAARCGAPQVPFSTFRPEFGSVLTRSTSGECRNTYARKVCASSSSRNEVEISTTEEALCDGCADTGAIGGPAWIIESLTTRTVDVTGYSTAVRESEVPIGTGVTAYDHPTEGTILLRYNEATVHKDSTTLFSKFQMREAGVFVDDDARCHGGLNCLIVDDLVIPMYVQGALPGITIRRPTDEELKSLRAYELTSPQPWNPQLFKEESLTLKEFETLEEDALNSRKHLTITNSKKPSAAECAPYFLDVNEDTMQHTLDATTAYGGISSHFPMRNQVQSMNPVLSRNRLLEGFATDTVFSTVTSYEGYNAVQPALL